MLDSGDSEDESAQNSFLKETRRNNAVPQAFREQVEARFRLSTSKQYNFPRVGRKISLLTPLSISSKILRVRRLASRTRLSQLTGSTQSFSKTNLANQTISSLPKLPEVRQLALSVKGNAKALLARRFK